MASNDLYTYMKSMNYYSVICFVCKSDIPFAFILDDLCPTKGHYIQRFGFQKTWEHALIKEIAYHILSRKKRGLR